MRSRSGKLTALCRTPLGGRMASAYSLAWDVSLRDRNSFHLDARARCLATVRDATALPSLLADPALQNLPLMVLGAGSNVLFATDRFEGCLIHLQCDSARIAGDDGEDALVHVDAEGDGPADRLRCGPRARGRRECRSSGPSPRGCTSFPPWSLSSIPRRLARGGLP